MKKINVQYLFLILGLVLSHYAYGQEKTEKGSAEELAKKLANPVASLISVPFQNNTDWGIGTFNGSKNTLNIQPVIPIKLSEKLNLITRWIFPVVSQNDITGDGTKEFGLSDATISAFFSPVGGKLYWALVQLFWCLLLLMIYLAPRSLVLALQVLF